MDSKERYLNILYSKNSLLIHFLYIIFSFPLLGHPSFMSLKVLVPVKRVVDYAVKVRVRPDKTGVELNNVKMSINPFCEIAIEEAARLKEKKIVQEIVLVSIGPKLVRDFLANAMAIGGDRSIHIHTELRVDQELQPLVVAKLLQAIVLKENPDFVLMGKQAIDDDSNQTGQMLAGLLKWSQGTFASQISFADRVATVAREVDGGCQFVSMKLPAVFTCDLRLNTPRFASLPNIMKAKKNPIQVIEASSFGIDMNPHLKVLRVEEPLKRQGGVKVDSVPALVSKLQSLGAL